MPVPPATQPADHVPGEQQVDSHLGAVLEEMIEAVQEAKQAVWWASDSEQRGALQELRQFLGDNAAAVADAEARIDGRSPAVASPAGHRPRNLGADAGGDVDQLLRLFSSDLEQLAADVRRRAGEIAGTEEAALLTSLAQGLEDRLARLSAPH